MNGTLLIIEKGNFVTLLKDPSIVFKRNFHLMYQNSLLSHLSFSLLFSISILAQSIS